MEDSLDVDLEHMISLIELRPMLWDRTSEDYKSRNLRSAAWHEICVILLDNFECLSLQEQNEKGRAIIKKWTNEREKWMKWKKRKESSGTSSCKKLPFADQLSFLEKIYEPSTSNLEATETESDQEDAKPTKSSAEYDMPEFVSTSSSRKLRSAKKRRSFDEFEIEQNSVKPTSTLASLGAETPILSFFRSLLPSLEEFDCDEQLEFQMQILNVIKSMKREKRRKFDSY